MAERRSPRVVARRPAVFDTPSGRSIGCRFVCTETIGLGGCMVRCPEPMEPDSRAEVRICLAGGVIRAACRVAYCRRDGGGEYEVGVEFLSVVESDRPLLDAVVARGVVARAAAGEGDDASRG